MDKHMTLPRLLATLQLASPGLPVGGFAYSQGLGQAIESGLVRDAASARRWIEDALLLSLARFEAPLWLRAFDACTAADESAFVRWNSELLAGRETSELRAETVQMGAALVRLMPVLGVRPPACDSVAFPMAFAAACVGLGVQRETGLAVYLWTWTENQVLVAVKSVPLGQVAGQTLLYQLHGSLATAVEAAGALDDEELGTAAVQYAVTSARHETQYSRVYRS